MKTSSLAAIGLLCVSRVALAQAGSTSTAPAGAPAVAPASALPPIPGPPVRKIESAQAISTEPLGAVNGVRQLSDGRILVNDGTRRRLLLFDSTLKSVSIVLDSLTEVENAYGTRAGALLGYRGDSTLFIDPATYAMLVLDPTGKIVRVRSVPRAQDVNWISNTSGAFGWPGFDSQGRLVYRIPAQTAPPAVAPPRGVPYIPTPPDSAIIVAIHLDTRKIDTLNAVKIPKQVYFIRQNPDGGVNVNSVSSPLPLVDDWAVLPDGTIAFVRGRDYRVEFLEGDGTITSSEKLAFPWVRLTQDDKVRMVDSMKALQTRNSLNNFTTNMIVWSNLMNKPYPSTFTVNPGYTLQSGMPRDWILPKGLSWPASYVFACAPGTTPNSPSAPLPALPAPGGGDAAAASGGTSVRPTTATAPSCVPNNYNDYYGNGYTPPAPTYRAPSIIPADELPDYKPPIAQSAIRADMDGNLWIRTIQMRPTQGGAIYDIVNRKGELVDRLQVPPGYNIAGFGAGKIVYLTLRDATGLHLARVRLK